jgi:transcription initiation factor TFIID subunit TAF12
MLLYVLQVLQQNEALEVHTSSLAAAKQQLQQQLAELSAAKAQLDAQVAELTAQQGGLLQHNQQLADRIEALHGSQQQLQSQVAVANDKLAQQQQQQQREQEQQAGGSGDSSAAVSLPVAPAGVAPRQGDLSVQVGRCCSGNMPQQLVRSSSNACMHCEVSLQTARPHASIALYTHSSLQLEYKTSGRHGVWLAPALGSVAACCQCQH